MRSEAVRRWGRSIVSSAPALTQVCLRAPFDRTAAFSAMNTWSARQRRIFGIDLSVEDRNDGRYDRPPYLFVHLNQTSLCEIILYGGTVPVAYRLIVNWEFALLPGIGFATVAAGARVIVRQRPAQAIRQIDRAIEDMRRGENYALSVEGRRSPDGRLQPYKRGAAVMAIRSGATIVPFVLRGACDRLPYGEWSIRPGPVHAVLCEQISTEGMTIEDRQSLTDRLRAIGEREIHH